MIIKGFYRNLVRHDLDHPCRMIGLTDEDMDKIVQELIQGKDQLSPEGSKKDDIDKSKETKTKKRKVEYLWDLI